MSDRKMNEVFRGAGKQMAAYALFGARAPTLVREHIREMYELDQCRMLTQTVEQLDAWRNIKAHRSWAWVRDWLSAGYLMPPCDAALSVGRIVAEQLGICSPFTEEEKAE